ncbi:MAG: 3-isopropylmalate dehydrogenase [Clostridium sp.]|nr:3-isopropylmalate dehydrogenase [Clostridium sp.]
MKLHIGCIEGDGIGPEIVRQARKVLEAMAKQFGHELVWTPLLLGGASIDAYGSPLTPETIEQAKKTEAILMGSIGGDTVRNPWYQLPPNLRPEAGLLGIRKALNLFANLRPAVLYPQLAQACPVKLADAKKGFDILIVRELTGGLYFGERSTVTENGVRKATDTLVYTEEEIRRVAHKAYLAARKRQKKVTSVDKANVLDSSRLWRAVTIEVAKEYPDVTLEHMLVDSCAMQLVKDPGQFDVIMTENMFGDILSDEASMITGSIGMLASASLNDTKFGLYEPSHGSAPDIAGKDVANPIATILSAAMLLRYSFDLEEEAAWIEKRVGSVLDQGYRSADLILSKQESDGRDTTPEIIKVGCEEMGDLIANK